jgi:hypothetical protein
MKIVIISTFKPLLPEFITEHTNALRSWKKLRCNPTIVIVGDDYGVDELCEKENVIHHPEVKKNSYGTPLVGDIIKQGWKHAEYDDICIFINGDIILTNSLCDSLDRFTKEYPNHRNMKYLLTSIRYDWYNFKPIDFSKDDWEQNIKLNMEGKRSEATAIDMFIHRKGALDCIESGIAKWGYDSWILGNAIKNFDLTINITNLTTIYHQYGKWYQDSKVCDRKCTKTTEMIENSRPIYKDIRSNNYKLNIYSCNINW